MKLRFRWSSGMVCLLALLLCGCPQGGKPAGGPGAASPTSTPADEATANLTDQEGRPAPPLRKGVTTFDGNWAMLIEGPQQELVIWLLQLTKGTDGVWSGKFLDSSRDQFKPEFEGVTVDGNSLKLMLKNEAGPITYEGTLADGLVRGTFEFRVLDISPARLWPTTAESLDKLAQALPPPGMEVFQAAASDKENPVRAMLLAAESAPNSPLAIEAYLTVLGRARQLQLKREQADRIVKGYTAAAATWGPKMVTRSKLMAAVQLTQNRLFPELVMTLLDDVEQSLGDQKDAWKNQIDMVRTNAKVEQALLDLRTTDDAKRKAANDYLRDPKLTSQHFNFEILYELARYAAEHDQIDQAIEGYSQLVALPLLETLVKEMGPQIGRTAGDPAPRDSLTELWTKKHGNADGLEAHLKEVYESTLGGLVATAKSHAPDPVAAPVRPVLVELMTGTECPPCVAADLATEALAQSYPGGNVIVLQLHQHIPMPDPLANLDSEERYSYYEAQGTPWILVDGQMLPEASGLLQQVEMVYLRLRQAIDTRLAMPRGAEITATAALENGELKVSAAATGYAEDMASSLRLRLALVEQNVAYKGSNGIPDHAYVVRSLLGGTKGAGVRKGELKYEGTLPMTELKQQLETYLTEFEAGRRVTFATKPLELKALHLAVWVQNDKTREVLGSLLIPVAGTAATAPGQPATETAPEPPADAAQPATDAPSGA